MTSTTFSPPDPTPGYRSEWIPPGPPGDDSEGDWLDWRAVIAPPPGPDSSTDGWIRHKIRFAGHTIAERAWYQRRRERRLYRQLCAEQGRTPDPHAPLVIYWPMSFNGVCLTCPWAGSGHENRSAALIEALEHQTRRVNETVEQAAWAAAFRHGPGTQVGTGVHADLVGRLRERLAELGIAKVSFRPVFNDHTDAWPLLDGVARYRNVRGSERPGSGLRVYGDNALLAVALLLDLTPPEGSTPPAETRRALQVQARLPHDVQIAWTSRAMRGSTEQMRAAAELLGPEPSPLPSSQRVGGVVPRRYFVTPRLTVDLDHGIDLTGQDAAALIDVGLHVTLDSENAARAALATLDVTQDQIDSAIRFGQTGAV